MNKEVNAPDQSFFAAKFLHKACLTLPNAKPQFAKPLTNSNHFSIRLKARKILTKNQTTDLDTNILARYTIIHQFFLVVNPKKNPKIWLRFATLEF